MSVLFVSDVHLDTASPDAVAQFLQFLTSHAAQAEALYILGDLFETWVGDDDIDEVKTHVRAGLQGLTDRGVACFILHGNRDFLLGNRFCEQTGCQLLTDPIVTELDGERVLVTHGDALCTDDRSYQELRSTVRTPQWQARFLALQLSVRRLLADRARAGSRDHTARIVPQIMDVNAEAVLRAFRATHVRRIIHGHTHRPGTHEYVVDGQNAHRIVLGAWYEQGSYLSYDSGRYQLHTLPRAD